MSASDIAKLFQASMNQDECNQMLFATKLSTVMSPFDSNWICSQLIPYLTVWLPRNNKNILEAICKSLPELIQKSGSLPSCSSFIEAILSSEDPKALAAVESSISSEPSPTIEGLISQLITSKYDSVRSFIPRLLSYTPSSSLTTCTTLASDSSFLVRFSVVKFIPILLKQSSDLNGIKELSTVLLKDPHARIRSYLPSLLCKTPFFFDELSQSFISDPDWSVRAALCDALINAHDTTRSIPVVVSLFNDSVWQVKLCALNSLTAILEGDRDFTISAESTSSIFESLQGSIHSDHICLKTAVIDCFFVVSEHSSQDALNPTQLKSFCDDLVATQPPAIRLHFLQGIAQKGRAHPIFIQLIKEKACKIVEALLSEDKWRVRLGVVEQLEPLSALIGDSEISSQFLSFCKEATGDEAYPVKESAMRHLAAAFLKQGKTVPEWIETQKRDTGFRKRQTAAMILGMMAQMTDDQEFKNTLREQVRSFENDPCDNVRYLADKFKE